MDDLISRQAAIDIASGYCHPANIAKELAKLPSAQPEIIRCKDCKWYEGDIMANPWGVCCHSGWVDGHSGHEVSEDGWCYLAGKMEVEHEADNRKE